MNESLKIVEPLTKCCTTCGEHKILSEFWNEKRAKTPYGKRAQCKKCIFLKRKSFIEKLSPEDKEKRKDRWSRGEYARNSNYKYKYGLTLDDVKLMYESQMRMCANRACGKDIVLEVKRNNPNSAFVDHNHITGKVRGLLCFKCNVSLGHLEDKNLVLGLVEYMNKYDEPLSYIKG